MHLVSPVDHSWAMLALNTWLIPQELSVTPSAIVDAFPLPAVLVGTDRKILCANNPARTILGSGEGERHYSFYFRQPELTAKIEAALDNQVEDTSILRLHLDGRETHFTAHISPLGENNGALVVLSDETKLRDAGRMRTDFVANVSHELRTPLTALSGFIETLRGPAKDDEEARDRFLTTMAKEVERMNRLVTDLLSLARIESPEGPFPRTRVDLCPVLAETIAMFAHRDDTDGKISVAGCDQPIMMNADPDLLRLALNNLIENAMKHGGGQKIEVQVTLHDHLANLRGPGVSIAIRDFGEGIAAHHLARLTERFYRVDKHRSRDAGGTGLGLAIVKHVLQRHLGRLQIESTPGEGSIFTVFLPISD